MTKTLDEIVKFLKLYPVGLIEENRDGRINSGLSEDIVLGEIQDEFGCSVIEIPEAREWYDFAIHDDDSDIYYVNLKISDLSNHSADNLSSKIGMGYALTGIIDLPLSWPRFNEAIINGLTGGFDYYFLIINKNNPCDVFWTSLKRINKLVPNGNNLPFQCDWSGERDWANRNELDATRYILEQYLESWDKKVKGYPAEIKQLLDNGDLYRL